MDKETAKELAEFTYDMFGSLANAPQSPTLKKMAIRHIIDKIEQEGDTIDKDLIKLNEWISNKIKEKKICVTEQMTD